MFDIEKNGVVSILSTDKALNAENVGQIGDNCNKLLTAARPKVVVDLSNVPLLDSRGLEWLLDTHEQCASRGGRLAIASPSTLCRDIINVTELGERCAIYDDLLSAIGSLS